VGRRHGEDAERLDLQRIRSSGSAGFSSPRRSTMEKFVTSVAFGHSSRVSSNPPVWSPSSWDTKIQRTSAGSTTANTFSSHRSRCTGAPVSTITGSSPRITIELTGRNRPSPGGARLGMRYVSGATRLVARLYGEHYSDRLHETTVHVG
jgi:hypothetical protein